MKELNEKDLIEVNGGTDLNGWQDFLKKMGKGIKNITKPVVKSGPAPVAATSPEEELGGRIIVTPTDESLKP